MKTTTINKILKAIDDFDKKQTKQTARNYLINILKLYDKNGNHIY